MELVIVGPLALRVAFLLWIFTPRGGAGTLICERAAAGSRHGVFGEIDLETAQRT